MTSLARLGKKIKISNNVYLIQKLKVINGVIDDNQNFSSLDKNGKINKLLPYDDRNFILSNQEYCYCDEYDVNELMIQYPKLQSIEAIKQQLKKMTDYTFYIVYYNKYENTIEPVTIDEDDFKDIIDISDGIDNISNMRDWNDGKAVSYVGEYILTTIETLRMITDEIENDEIDDALLSLQSACDQYEIEHNLDKQIEDEINSGSEEIIINYENEEQKNNKKEVNNEKSFEEIMQDLKQLIGMDNIKKQVNKLSTYLSFLEKIKTNELNINLNQPNLNMVFLGNPGTGKTTIARIISQILNNLGYANGKFKEVSAQDFIAGYVGQTALKTEKLLKEIHGGVLFIDEAYSLTMGSDDASYGNEAIAVLLKEMEKNETIFIFSGYKVEMEKFIKSNSGLTSRIGNNFEFNDYTVDELLQMFMNKINKSNFILDNKAKEEIRKILENVTNEKDFGNGRYIDKLFDNIVVEHAYNTANTNDINELKTITENDLVKENINQLVYKKGINKKIGF